jgi:hypothetical protein
VKMLFGIAALAAVLGVQGSAVASADDANPRPCRGSRFAAARSEPFAVDVFGRDWMALLNEFRQQASRS